MERRDFLKLGSAAGVGAAIVGPGCLPGMLPKRVSQSEIDRILGQMNTGLDHVSHYDMLEDFSKRTGTPTRLTDDDRALSRTTMRALYTSAMFRSMPEEVQMHPAMQEQMFGHLAEMDDAVFGMTDRMASVPHDQRDHVRRRLNADPSLPEKISEGIDTKMGRLKMPLTRRVQMRAIFSQVGWRMQKQSPSAVIDEYVDKVVKATSQVGSHVELERRITAQVGQESYWRYQNHLALMFTDDPQNAGGGAPPPPQPGPPPTGPMPPPQLSMGEQLLNNARQAASRQYCETVDIIGRQLSEIDPAIYQRDYLSDPAIVNCHKLRDTRPPGAIVPAGCDNAQSLANQLARKKVIGTGGWMLGIGLISGVVGGVAVGANSGALAAIALTLGGVLLIGGLIVLLVGAIVSVAAAENVHHAVGMNHVPTKLGVYLGLALTIVAALIGVVTLVQGLLKHGSLALLWWSAAAIAPAIIMLVVVRPLIH
jgi:hypothetical protein